MKSFKILNKTHICTFNFIKKHEYIHYIIKKIDKENYDIVECCTVFISSSRKIFRKKIKEYIKFFKLHNESLKYFENIPLNDDEVVHVSLNCFIMCPECTNKTKNFNCFDCSYYKFILNKCQNKIEVDNKYKLFYADHKNSSGIIFFNVGENSELRECINLCFKSKSTIKQVINILKYILEFAEEE